MSLCWRNVIVTDRKLEIVKIIRDIGKYHTNPVVCPQIRKAVYFHYIPSTKDIYCCPEYAHGYSNSNIGDYDEILVSWSEIGSVASKVKMTTFPPRRSRHSWKSEIIDQKIKWECHELVTNQFQ